MQHAITNQTHQTMMSPSPFHYPCHHRTNIPLPLTLLNCLFLSSFFVFSLYTFVPSSIRRLPRDHCVHIRWRSGVIFGVMMVGMGTYPLIFCQRLEIDDILGGDYVGDRRMDTFPSWYRYLGISWQPMQDIKIAAHVLVLYLGSLSCSWLRSYHCMRLLQWENESMNRNNRSCMRTISTIAESQQLPTFPKPKYFRRSLQQTWVEPTMQSILSFYNDENYRWMKLRNLFIAPLAEEAIFRACLIPPLLASTSKDGEPLSPIATAWIGPLFFGVAHLHHFYEQYRQMPPWQRSRNIVFQLLFGLLFQWAYTTLFGAYVSHVFIRTASLSVVTLAHVVCNYVGLPEIGFVNPTSNLYCYRWIISILYLVGICLFVAGFDSLVFPTQSVLPSLLYPQR